MNWTKKHKNVQIKKQREYFNKQRLFLSENKSDHFVPESFDLMNLQTPVNKILFNECEDLRGDFIDDNLINNNTNLVNNNNFFNNKNLQLSADSDFYRTFSSNYNFNSLSQEHSIRNNQSVDEINENDEYFTIIKPEEFDQFKPKPSFNNNNNTSNSSIISLMYQNNHQNNYKNNHQNSNNSTFVYKSDFDLLLNVYYYFILEINKN